MKELEMSLETGRRESRKIVLKAAGQYLRNNIALIVFAIVVVIFSILNSRFLSFANFANIGRQAAMIIVMACGMTMVIVSANIDLSVASTLSLAGMLSGIVVEGTGSVWLAILTAAALGLSAGLVNGLLVTRGRIPSFLATLGMMGILRGLAMLVTDTKPVVIYSEPFWRAFGDFDIVGFFPISILWTIVVIVLTHITLTYTSLGRYIYATGGNQEAAYFTGINTRRTIVTVFMMMGLLAAFAGVMFASRMHAARPGTGEGMELNVIAAVILGGTSLSGGKGTIIGSIIGALTIGTLNNGLIILGFNTHVQMLVRGLVIIMAVLISREK
ncbi:MAG: ABC transporter permease [Candidatus Caldatribacteriaceae bacterium]